MKRFFIWLKPEQSLPVLAALLALMSMASSSAEAADRVLLVGVGTYQNSRENLPDLPGIGIDIQRMTRVAGLLGYESGQIKILQDENATAINVEKAIGNWLGQAGADDRVLFYFSGHGTRIYDDSADEADGVDEVLCFHDMSLQNRGDRYSFDGVITDDRFGVLLSRLKSEHILIVLDHCFSGTSTKALNLNEMLSGPTYVSKSFRYIGMPLRGGAFASSSSFSTLRFTDPVVLSSCRDDEESVSSESGSLFTEGVAAAMEEQAQKQGAAPEQLFDTRYLQEYATEYIRKTLGAGRADRMFHPQLQGNMLLTLGNSKR